MFLSLSVEDSGSLAVNSLIGVLKDFISCTEIELISLPYINLVKDEDILIHMLKEKWIKADEDYDVLIDRRMPKLFEILREHIIVTQYTKDRYISLYPEHKEFIESRLCS